MEIRVVIRKVASPFRWLFTKKRCWIPVLVVFSIITFPFIAYGGFLLYQNIDSALDEGVRLEKLKKELRINEELWETKNYKKYEFRLSILPGEDSYREPIRYGPYAVDKEDSLWVKVDNSIVIVVDDRSANSISTGNQIQYPISISDLYGIIHAILDNPNSLQTNEMINNMTKVFGFIIDLSPDKKPLKIQIDFNESYGIPEKIGIYYEFRYFKQYLLTYKIYNFYGYWTEEE